VQPAGSIVEMAAIAFCVKSGLSAEELCRPSLACTASVLDLKAAIEDAAGIPAREQRLLLGKRVMGNGALLEDLMVPLSSELVEVSLVRTHPSNDPQWRKNDFRNNYHTHGFDSSTNRWDFYHARVNMETDLNRGMTPESQIFVTLQQGTSQTVTFSLCSLDFPMQELFDTFAEQSGVRIIDLRFRFQGRLLGRGDTPHLCGMEPCDRDDAHVIDVERADGQGHRQHIIAILNKMGNAVELMPCSLTTTCAFPLGADILLRGLLSVSLEDLLSTTMVNTFWFHATQRLSLMLQLRHGDVVFTRAPPEEYKAWLTSVFGHSQELALAEAQGRHKEKQVWQGLNVSKEKARKSYTFTKAAGCTEMKTVSLAGVSAEFEQQWLSMHSCKAKFMADCRERCKGRAKQITEDASNDTHDPPHAQIQALPPAGSEIFIAEAVSLEFRSVAIELFRRYFSPDMYFIFPLIVGQDTAFGLDFRSTTTTLFFGPQKDFQVTPVAPVGACSWRFRWPLLPESRISGAPDIEQPLPVLEVLFIAVWEEERYQVHGGTLVAEFEAQARAAGVKMMYVEIGFEQPKARRFWRKQGFGKVVRLEASEIEKQQLLDAEEQEDVPVPLVPLTSAQLDFFESNCLRFSDTAQYVKIFQ